MINKKFTVAQLLMIKRVLEFVFGPSQSGITNSIPNLLAVLNSLTNKSNSITTLLAQYDAIITGYAAYKKQARLNLVTSGYTVMRAAYALAVDNNDNVLKEKVKGSLGRLKVAGCVKLSNLMTDVVTVVTPIVNDLVPYNPNIVTQFDDMQDNLTTLNSLLVIPQSLIKLRKDIGKQIKTEMSTTMKFVRNSIDSIVASNMTTYPQYASGYFTQREIINPNDRHNRINATVQNEVGEPFIDVQVTVMEYLDPNTGKTYPAVTGNTGINGQVTVRKFWPGNRMIKISGPGIITKEFGPYYFHSGHEVTKVFIVQPDFNNLPQSTEKKEKVNK